MKLKTAFVSGITSGVGKELAIGLAKRGFFVIGICTENNLWEVKELVEKYDIEVFPCDVSLVSDIKRFIGALEARQTITDGKLDLIIHADVRTYGGPAIETPDEELESVFRVNVFGQILLTKYLADYVINAKGTVVFSSSTTSRLPIPWMSVFAASNAAIDQYALILRSELKPFGVTVRSIVVGLVETGQFSGIETGTVLTSHYTVDSIYPLLKLLDGDSKESAQVYASKVLSQVLDSWWPGYNIYGGAKAYVSYFAARWLPLWVLEFILGYKFRLFRVWGDIKRRARAS